MLNTLENIKDLFVKNIYNKHIYDTFFVNKKFDKFLIKECFLKIEMFNQFGNNISDIEQDLELSDVIHFKNITVNNYYNYYGSTKTNSYTFKQSTASTTWVVVHNLGYYPSLPLITDLDGNELDGVVVNNTINMTTITFSSAQSGYAYFS